MKALVPGFNQSFVLVALSCLFVLASLYRARLRAAMDEHYRRFGLVLALTVAATTAFFFDFLGPYGLLASSCSMLILTNKFRSWRVKRAWNRVVGDYEAEIPLVLLSESQMEELGEERAPLSPMIYRDEEDTRAIYPLVSGGIPWSELPRSALQFICAHEFAHAHLGHLEEESDVPSIVVGGILAAGASLFLGPEIFLGWLGGTTISKGFTTALSASYSRTHERDADLWATVWCLQHGFDVEAAADLLAGLGETYEEEGLFIRIKNWFTASHPQGADRQKDILRVVRAFRSGGIEAACAAAGLELLS